MNAKTSCTLSFILLSLLTVPHGRAADLTDEDAVEVLRSVIRVDREAVVTKALQLTAAESEKFWPLYHEYRAEMEKVGDGLLKVMQSYATFYPDVPQQAAEKMLKDLARLEDQQSTTRAEYLRKIGKVLPAAKTLRFAQVDNRLALALRVELAAKIPLVPVAGQTTPSSSTAARVAEGVPGGVVVETHELTATVTAVDYANRRLHLLSADGFRQTVKVEPEASNFDQIRAGDKLKVTVTEELVVQMADPGEPPATGKIDVVKLAPKGAKPGGVVAQTTQVTATITSIDPQKRTVTLRFQDGSARTFPVRSDIDLGKHNVGDKVVFRLTEAVALSVKKP